MRVEARAAALYIYYFPIIPYFIELTVRLLSMASIPSATDRSQTPKNTRQTQPKGKPVCAANAASSSPSPSSCAQSSSSGIYERDRVFHHVDLFTQLLHSLCVLEHSREELHPASAPSLLDVREDAFV